MRSIPLPLLLPPLLAAIAASSGGTQDAEPPPTEDGGRDGVLHEEISSDIRFLEARGALAGEDDFSLVVDLPNSLLVLEYGGVPLRACKIRRAYVDGRLQRSISDEAFRQSLATPFRLMEKTGTLPENPPPLETDERGVPKPLPEERKSTAAFTLHYDPEMRLHMMARPESGGGRGGTWNRVRMGLRRLGAGLAEWFQRGEKDLFLELDPEDCVVVYRALPRSTGMALRL